MFTEGHQVSQALFLTPGIVLKEKKGKERKERKGLFFAFYFPAIHDTVQNGTRRFLGLVALTQVQIKTAGHKALCHSVTSGENLLHAPKSLSSSVFGSTIT